MYLNVIEGFAPPDIIQTFTAFLQFCYIAHRNVITEDSLEELNKALKQFHKYCAMFSGAVRADGLARFLLPQQHSMVHYHNNIKNFGAPNGLCSSITESKHITAIKSPWHHSSRYKALSQILKANQRLDKLVAARVDFANCRMLVNPVLITLTPNTTSDNGDNNDNYDNANGSNDSNNNNNNNNNNNSDGDGGDSNGSDSDDGDSDHEGNSNDDDHVGPVGSGPLMNKVWLARRKGKFYSIYTSIYSHESFNQLLPTNIHRLLQPLESRTASMTCLILSEDSCSTSSTPTLRSNQMTFPSASA